MAIDIYIFINYIGKIYFQDASGFFGFRLICQRPQCCF
jgi:hypothetical protein